MIPIHPLTICLIVLIAFAFGLKIGEYLAFDKAQKHITQAIRADRQHDRRTP